MFLAPQFAATGVWAAALSDYGLGTTWRLLLFLTVVALLLFVALPRRAAALWTAGLAASSLLVASPAARQLTPAGLALGIVLREPAAWIALACAGLPVAALAPRVSWTARPGAEAWYSRVVYVSGTAALLGWWYWSGSRDHILALPYLPDLERQALGLVAVVLVLGTLLQLALSFLAPSADARRALRVDLLASLAIVVVPVAATAASYRTVTPLESSAGVSWVVAALGGLVALRSLIAARLLLDIAERPATTTRRLATGVFAIVLALSLATASWRAIVLPPGGDEPQYLGATMTIWRYGNLDLPAGVFSPEMTRLVASSPYPRDVHLYDDNTRDRLVLSTPLTSSTSLYLPVAGGGGLSATLELLNNDIETAGTRVVFRDATGREVSAYDVVVPPGRQLLLRSPNSNTQLTATITAGKPISVAARLSDSRAGDELYGASRAVPKRCIPLALGASAPRSELVVQNVLSSPARAVIRELDARGATRAEQKVTVPANGSAAAPLRASGELGAACVVADGPVASVVLTRDNPGLRVQQADSAVSDPIAIPMPEAVQGHRGHAEILLYNPGASPVEVSFFNDVNDGTASSREQVPPGGTARFTGEQSGRDLTHTTGWLNLGGPMVVNVVSTVGAHTASAAPHTAANTSVLLPVLGPQSRRYTDSILELSNFGDTPTLATAKLVTTQGATVWQDKIWVCGHCVETRRVWYQNPVDGVLAVESTLPIKSTFLQREVVVAWAYHSLGLSLLVLPGYVIAGWGGVLTSLAIIAALLASALFGLMLDAGISRRTAVGVTLVASASSPLLTYAAQLYPELAGTLLLIAGLRLLLRGRVWATAAGVALLALVPIVHTRLLPLAILALAASLLPRLVRAASGPRRPSRKRAAAWLIVSIAALAVVVALAWRIEPRTRPAYLAQYFGLAAAGPHFIGLLFDWASGLLPAFPALLFAGAGLVWLARGRTSVGLAAVLLALAPLALVALRRDGWETTPPARYLIPATPFLAVAVAAVWDRVTPRALRFIGVVVVAWGLAGTFLFVWVPRGIFLSVTPLRWYGDDLFRYLFGVNPFALFPSLPANLDYALTPATATAVLGLLVVATAVPLAVNWRSATEKSRHPAPTGSDTTATT